MKNILQKLRQELGAHKGLQRHAGTPSDATDVDQRARRWAERAHDTLEDLKRHVEHTFRTLYERWYSRPVPDAIRPHPCYYQTIASRSMEIAAWTFIFFEGLLASLLSLLFLVASHLASVVIGLGLTILLAFGVKGLLMPHFLERHEERPRAARDGILRWLAVLLPLEFVLLGIGFLLRGASDVWTASFGWLFPYVTSLLTLVTLVLAALLWLGAALFGWSARRARNWNEIDLLQQEVDDLRAEGGAAPAERSGPRPVVAGHTLVLLFVGLLGLAPLGSRVEAAPQAAATRCTASVWIDTTVSVLQRDLDAAQTVIGRQLGSVGDACDVGEWQIYEFSDDAWRATPVFRRQMPRFVQPACHPPAFSQAERLFKGAREISEQRALAACERARDAATRDYQRQREMAFAELQQRIAGRPKRTAGGTCTGLWDLMLRLSQQTAPAVSVVLTDGLETCLKVKPGAISAPLPGISVIVVLVAARKQVSDSGAQDFRQRRARIQAFAPWATVVPAWGLISSLEHPADTKRQ